MIKSDRMLTNTSTSKLIKNLSFIIKKVTLHTMEIEITALANDENDIRGYQVFVIENIDKTNIKSYVGEEKNVVITELRPNTEYSIYVAVYDKNNDYKISELQNKRTENYIYLYNKGITDLTINLGNSGGANSQKNTTYLYGEFNDDRTNNSSMTTFLISNLDVTNIKHIYIHFYDVSATTDTSIYGSLCNSYSPFYLFPMDCITIDKRTNQIFNNAEFIIDINVTNVTGIKNLTFGGACVPNYEYNYNDAYTGSAVFKIDEIYYE